jgi:hypothetical protein
MAAQATARIVVVMAHAAMHLSFAYEGAAWALTDLFLYGLLFVQLPDEASYLMPALLGLYWLLCRCAPQPDALGGCGVAASVLLLLSAGSSSRRRQRHYERARDTRDRCTA